MSPSSASYLIDTCSLINVQTRPNPARAWTILLALADAGRLKTCWEAWHELERGSEDDVLATLSPVKDVLVLPRSGINVLPEVGRIFATYAAVAKPTGNRERADGYLIAHAKVFGYCIVTDERRSASLRRIPGVCAAEGIGCMDLRSLLSAESGMAA